MLGLGVLYHLYAGVLSNKVAAFRRGRSVDLRELLALCVEAAVQGGREAKRAHDGGVLSSKAKGKTREGAEEMLTLGDLNSHRRMYYLIKNRFPHVQVISEERDYSTKASDAEWNSVIPDEILQKVQSQVVPAEAVTVWIDPLDATQEYTGSLIFLILPFLDPVELHCFMAKAAGGLTVKENLLQYVTTMACVAVNGKPFIGVIHKPFTGYTAWAMVDSGSNVLPRSSYNAKSPSVIVSRSHAGKVKGYIDSAFGNNTVIIQAGGAGYKVLSLLNPADEKYDKADIYIHITYIKKWDICAGNAILKALGGHMTTLRGEEIDYTGSESNEGGLLATVKLNHKELLEKLPNLDQIRSR
ncbi:inositol monophosphatase 3-like [Scleropages formosus]|uniref:inositol-phosphate phosphatase n=1 Tax=Scleropages formosus TaxID=113540 RepID=A0A0P7XYB1_SCLFO|nr:inositol monophosphatase 3-like [Scleropages formosus]